MQRGNSVKKSGFIGMSLLILLVFLALIINGLVYFIHKEIITQKTNIRHHQVANMGRELLRATIRHKKFIKHSFTQELPEITLYPGGEKLNPQVEVINREEFPLKVVNIDIPYKEGHLKMQQMEIDVPGGSTHGAYIHGMLDISQHRGNVPRLDIEGLHLYKNMPLPNQADIEQYGLLDRLYCNNANNQSKKYTIKPFTVIRGSGILYNDQDITLGENCACENKVWIISNNGIDIRDGVILKKTFIFSNGDVSIGDDVTLNGIIIAAGKIYTGDNFYFTEDKKAIETFSTACYFI